MGKWYLVYVLMTHGSILNTRVLPIDVRYDGFKSLDECHVVAKAVVEVMPKKAADGTVHPNGTWRYQCVEWQGE
jgi:hypothetical protein